MSKDKLDPKVIMAELGKPVGLVSKVGPDGPALPDGKVKRDTPALRATPDTRDSRAGKDGPGTRASRATPV